MRVLVCGGRKFYNKALLKATLDALHKAHPISCIIQGGANGADFLAKHWATAYGGMKQEEYKADWKAHGISAGSIRNSIMLRLSKPDLVVAFGSQEKGTRGTGTADMVKKARAAKVKVLEIEDA
jgi:hypothetical protein